MPTVQVRDVNIFYEEEGQGEPILWLHPSGGGSHIVWRSQVPAFRSTYRCVMPDHRDCGQSSESPGPYTVLDLAEDALGVLDHLGIARAHVVGFSMGGAVAQQLAIHHPDRVNALMLIGTYTSSDPRGADIMRWGAKLRTLLSPEDYAHAHAPWSLTYREYQNPEFIRQYFQRAVENPARMSQAAHERQVEAVLSHEVEDKLHLITAPTLVVCGEDDILTPLRFARTLVNGIPNARLEVIPEVGHGLLGVKPAAVTEVLVRFLASLEQE